MIGRAEVIILKTENGTREVLSIPLMLQSKNPLADIKNGIFNKLYFYENWRDKDYQAYLDQEYIPEDFKTEKFLLYFGQDFSKYYLGYVILDIDNKRYSIPEDQADNSDNLKILGDLIFNPEKETRFVTIFKPTRPSDINLIEL